MEAGLTPAVVDAVRTVARAEILPRARLVRGERKSDGSLFTEADTATQAALIERLCALRDCPVIGEEMTREAQRSALGAGEGSAWCIDPIDGTTNFLQGIPYYAVSVALLERGRATLGVVHNPATGETFHATLGGGAYVDGERIEPRAAPEDLAHALASLELKRVPDAAAARIAAARPWYSYRNFGAAALDWCWLAAGRFDVYVHANHMLWDYAAGQLVLAEAGGVAATFASDDFLAGEPWAKSVLAARTPRLLRLWGEFLREALRAEAA